MPSNAPIGVFDSGVGGLSVLREIRSLLPHEHLIYIADSRYVPYGNKTKHLIQKRAIFLSDFLCHEGVKAIVVACNTATAAAAELLRDRLSVPVIGMEPAVKPAAAASRNRKVGVLATEGTLNSSRFAALLSRFANGLDVYIQSCHGLVEQVEKGAIDDPVTRELLSRYLEPLRQAEVDTLILGCTHYPFLKPVIRDIVGPDIALIDTGAAVARHLKHRLEETGRLSEHPAPSISTFWTSGDCAKLHGVISALWPEPSQVHSLPVDSVLDWDE